MPEPFRPGTLVFYARHEGEVEWPWEQAVVHSYDAARDEYLLKVRVGPPLYSREPVRVPANWVEAETTEDCIHEEQDYLELIRLENKPVAQTWLPGAPVIPGTVWCYSHTRWETQGAEI